MASIKQARGLLSGKTFQAAHITDPIRYAEMISEPLVDEMDMPLAAVRKQGSPHFRRLGTAQSVRMLPRGTRSKRHNETIASLHAQLQHAGRDITIFTYVFDEDGGSDTAEQTLFSLKAGSDFRWYSESPISLDDFTCIQPDLSGRDISRMAPTMGRPAVIIEVIDTHFPELQTFEKLMALSRAAHHIYFLVMGQFQINHAQKLYKFTLKPNEPLRLRSAWALINGELLLNGVAQSLDHAPPEHRSAVALGILESVSKRSR